MRDKYTLQVLASAHATSIAKTVALEDHGIMVPSHDKNYIGSSCTSFIKPHTSRNKFECPYGRSFVVFWTKVAMYEHCN